MPCLIALVIFGMPRVALFLVWLFGNGYLSLAYPAPIWPILGFFFLPFTTLAFAYAHVSLLPAGDVQGFGWLLVGLAVLADLGAFGGSERMRRRG